MDIPQFKITDRDSARVFDFEEEDVDQDSQLSSIRFTQDPIHITSG
jgi:hypothetical protein